MKRALSLARRGAGKASPNPMVGAVVVRRAAVVGEGFHTFEGKHHAEVLALEKAGSKALGATLYLNLEPCCHFGRTPPCVDRIIEAGIRKLVVATRDPNPRVAGRGIVRLREQGIEVVEGVCAAEALRLNEAFFHFVQWQRPFTVLKLALTLDGKIATSRGDSKWITGRQARNRVQRLRYESDAILVGINTALQDDPRLDVRGRVRNSIVKVVLDSRLRTPARSRLFESGDPVILFCDREVLSAAGDKRGRELAKRARLIGVSRSGDGLCWTEILAVLGKEQILSLLVEGGARVAASALKSGSVQKAVFFVAPRIIGSDGTSGVGSLGVHVLKDAPCFQMRRLQRVGTDLMIEAYPQEGGSVSTASSHELKISDGGASNHE